jgi:hypothetical protein
MIANLIPISPQPIKNFEILCQRASRENWCWNIFCFSCNHQEFCKAFSEMTDDGFNEYSNPFTGKNDAPKEDQSKLSAKLTKASLSWIHANCKFPDWLGYLALGVHQTRACEWESRILTKAWAPQLIEMLVPRCPIRKFLAQILESDRRVLRLSEFEDIERFANWKDEPYQLGSFPFMQGCPEVNADPHSTGETQ